MKLVHQEDRSGCVLACLAMLSGKPYQHVRTLFVKHFPKREWHLKAVGQGAGVRHHEIRKLCKLLEINPLVVTATTPFIVSFVGKWGRHMVIFDERGKMYDSATPKRRKRRKK